MRPGTSVLVKARAYCHSILQRRRKIAVASGMFSNRNQLGSYAGHITWCVRLCLQRCENAHKGSHSGTGTESPFPWSCTVRHQGCVIMTHDLETTVARDFEPNLMHVNAPFGINSSFQIVPE